MDPESRTRAVIEEHWRASELGETEAEHAIYATDAVLDYPQSGERFRGRATIAAQRGGHPASRHFTVHRIAGGGDLWVSECVITYDGVPSYSVRWAIGLVPGAERTELWHGVAGRADPGPPTTSAIRRPRRRKCG